MMMIVAAPSSLTADRQGYLATDVCQRACLPPGDTRYSLYSCHLATLSVSGKDEPRIVCDESFYSGGSGGSLIGPLPSGRAPSGLQSSARRTSYWAEVAHLEAASVVAFQRLEMDLAEHGAPRTLRRRARSAARDESRHTRMARRFARDVVPPVRVLPWRERSLEEVARENVVEGCVRETYAALVAEHQSTAASDRALQRAMKQIARDEARHAALAWCVHRWAMAQLGAPARARVQRARVVAERELAREVAETSPALASVVGVPHGLFAVALVRALFDRIQMKPIRLGRRTL